MAINNGTNQINHANSNKENGLNGNEEEHDTSIDTIQSDLDTVDHKLIVESSHAFGKNFLILPTNNQIKELQTVIRDKNTTRSDFVFNADRLIRLVVEEGLNQLPSVKCEVLTPLNQVYDGLKYSKGNCGVSIIRSGEAMEQGLRDCCRSIRIGKILVQSHEQTHEARVLYAKLPCDIDKRRVLLLYPILSTGNTIIKAVQILKEHNVVESRIILLNLFCTPAAIASIVKAFPSMKILTSELHPVAPLHFGKKYFGLNE